MMEKVLIIKDKWQVLKHCLASDKDSREALQGINVTAKHIEATDGRIAVRLHRDCMSVKENGAYKIISTRKHSTDFVEVILEPCADQYPDFNLVYPESGIIKDGDGFNIRLMPEKISSTSISGAMIRIYKRTNNAISAVLLGKLTPVRDDWTAYSTGQDKAVLLRDGSGMIEALVLPFKLD